MRYNLPDIPTGQRWQVRPALNNGFTRLELQEKHWWGWKVIEWTVVDNSRVDVDIVYRARNILENLSQNVEYGTQDGTL